MADYESDVQTQQSTWEIIKEEIVHLKWRVLVFCCFLTFGSYYIYDFPGAIGTGPDSTIQAKFIAHNKEYTQEMNQLLYSVYSWPNTVLAIFGGLLIDKFLGLRKAMILFVILVTLGSGLFYLGVLTLNFPLMVFARVIFGLGGESLSVAQSAFVARWFKDGRGLALAFGITVSFSRVGSSFNFLFSPMIATDAGIDTSVMCGMFACVFSLVACFVLVACDIYGTKKGLVPPESKETSDPFALSDITKLPFTVWLICGCCVFSYTAIFPFVGIAKNFFQVKYDMSGDDAARWVSIYQFTCAGGSPVVGGLVDGSARNTLWMIMSTGLFALIHLLFLTTPIPPAFQMAFMGVCYSMLVSSLWPAVPYAVDPSVVGLAYGIMTALQNLGLAIFPIVTGAILDAYPGANPNTDAPVPLPHNSNHTHNVTHNAFHYLSMLAEATTSTDSSSPTPAPTQATLPSSKGYNYTEILFMASAIVSMLFAIWLLIVDKRHTGVLSASASARKELLEAQQKLIGDTDSSADDHKINKSGENTPMYT